jgi:hypothetical protein
MALLGKSSLILMSSFARSVTWKEDRKAGRQEGRQDRWMRKEEWIVHKWGRG